ncbi:MAG: hypothetical protein ACYC1F_10430 [Gallionellaceae bacterium]
MMNERLKWMEDEARANAIFHVDSAAVLVKEANTTLNLLLAGAGGALAYMVALVQQGGVRWAAVGMAAVSVYLFALAALLIFKCLRIQPIWPTSNEPQNLNQPEMDFEQLRNADLESKQRCIERNRERNDRVGMWLNRCRAWVTITPVVFVLASALAY